MRPAQVKSQGFNEIHDSDGNIRVHYKNLYDHWQSIPASKRKRLHSQSKKLFSGDYALDPLPRVITQAEFLTLRQGVEQRAKAIMAFLRDYYSKGTRWKKVIPPTTLDSIINRNHDKSVLGRLNPETIAFPFGPDIIRDQNGKWRVIEDSAGFLGGVGDLLASRKIMFQLVPDYRGIFKYSNDPKEFFLRLTSHYRQKAEEKGGIPLLYLAPFKFESDNETRRLGQLYESLGIEVATPENPLKKLIINQDGMFLKTPRRKKRISYITLYAGPEQTDVRTLSYGFKSLVQKTKKTDPIRIHSMSQLLQGLKGYSIESSLLKNQALTNFSPGVQFINDKGFGLFVDDLIRFYLKESPILESIPARSFAFRSQKGKWLLDRGALKNATKHKDHLVIKRVDEDGGTGVWIGHKHTRKACEKVVDSVRNDPEKYIFQEFEHLSVLENRIVDLRIHAHVDSDDIIVSNNPWGRANWVHNDGKVNLGSNGFTSPVVIVP